jgi:two-component system chemotaxis response regulator CheB
MDVEMPGMDGIRATERIMALPDPPAIVMVSHHTREGTDAALAALDKGAVDFFWKGSSAGSLDLGQLDRMLRSGLRHWAAQRRAARLQPDTASRRESPASVRPRPQTRGGCDLVLIGASTGGPDAVASLLAAAGPLPVPCVVAQHMPADLGPDFCRHLARRLGRPALLGEAGMVLEPGGIIVLPGGTDGHLVRAAGSAVIPVLQLRLAASEAAVHPSVDLLLQSAALVARQALAVIMTGMGRDGEQGARAMVERGMLVLAQSPESCVVAGMPGAVIESGLVSEMGDPAALGRRALALTAPVAAP